MSLQFKQRNKSPSMAKTPNTEWTVYIIQAKSGKLYTGITNDLERRLAAHKSLTGARFFHFSSPDKIIFQEPQPNRSEATKREIAIKKMSRQEKLSLISYQPIAASC